ncbi:cation diffusion facilitator family transporter [Agrococcus jejuensis]|uniref:Divalent metal cation (Fe/Co/Zn/Cd) transporter n=1 Tax=Agrococcus jejuensis TaxID=399736 RepID=A0A1G8DSU6_9MICO|nr:cation transporter [Agrococcus jejuensis]SDH60665.1 Divalent metal cation (Fe/Co/Zn/Cd) transporter [Agrococcus jejuensis]
MTTRTASFGATELPERERDLLRRAVRLEWVTLAFLAVTVTLVYLTVGSSQAMRAAFFEDLLSFIPPIAFLVAVRIIRTAPSERFPYGLHRTVGIGHLVSAVALTGMGTFLIVESISTLVAAEHPTVGTVVVLGHVVWLGWLMIGVMALTIVPPIVIGRIKIRLAERLHDKLLYADADMNKADWTTAVGSIVGVTGIGLGIWWLDSAAALFIAVGILRDGLRNLRIAVLDLIDHRATTVDHDRPHPLEERLTQRMRRLAWVSDAGCRVRDQGHVLHAEVFLVARRGRVSQRRLDHAARAARSLDWKLQDVVIVPVAEVPEDVTGGRRRAAAIGGVERD